MNIIRVFDHFFPPKIAYAHCDVPCGIYKIDAALTAAQTVVKMVDKLIDPPPLDEKDKQSRLDFHNNMTRFVIVKEQHAQICKQEVLILWTDFFKAEHLEKWPDLHEKVWKIVKLCSDNKREVNADKAKDLLEQVTDLGDVLKQAQGSVKK